MAIKLKRAGNGDFISVSLSSQIITARQLKSNISWSRRGRSHHCPCRRAYGFQPEETARPAGQPGRSYSQWEYFFAMGERLDGSRQAPKQIFFSSAHRNSWWSTRSRRRRTRRSYSRNLSRSSFEAERTETSSARRTSCAPWYFVMAFGCRRALRSPKLRRKPAIPLGTISRLGAAHG